MKILEKLGITRPPVNVAETPSKECEPVMPAPKQSAALRVAENFCRPMVLDYMMESTQEDWPVSMITFSQVGEAISVNIFSENPGLVIGTGGKRMEDMRKYIGRRLSMEHGISVPIYVNARFKFDPFSDSPLVAIEKSFLNERSVPAGKHRSRG